jgi:hypothetical protein
MKTKSSQSKKSKSLITNLRESTLFVSVAALVLIISALVFVMPIFAQNIEEKLIFSDNNGNIVSLNPDGSGHQIIGSGAQAKVSHDGQKIAFINGACGQDLCAMNYDGTGLVHLTNSPFEVSENNPQWNHDSSLVAYNSSLGGTWVVGKDGSNPRRVLTGTTGADWSPDGTKLVFATGDNRIGVANADGSGITYILSGNDGGQEPTWSPDGKYIAYVDVTSQNRIGIMSPDGSGRQIIVTPPLGGDVSSPDWSPDSTRIVFAQSLGQEGGTPFGPRLFVSDITGVTSQVYADGKGVNYPSWANLQVVPPDTTPPNINSASFSVNPKPRTNTSTLIITASDPNGSGVRDGEYFIGETDPGPGGGTHMNFNGTDLRTDFGTDFVNGTYRINFRVRDNVGNWSAIRSEYLVVYSDGLSLTGRRTIVPNFALGDVLPGLVATGQSDKAVFSFSAKYDSPGHIAGSSGFDFTYKTGQCKGRQVSNCHSFDLTGSTINWFFTTGTNESEGTFQGTAKLTVDGTTSTVLFQARVIDGNRQSPAGPDKLEFRIYEDGADPARAVPIYILNSGPLDQGDIKIS